ncbi:MAG: molecular chaperone HtpG [Bacillota bacterium]
MYRENGQIEIHTDNIFPIIKKWLYSDKDIFVRELISNGCDAVTKLKRLSAIGEAKISEEEVFYVKVVFNKEKGIIRFEDNGIGMTAEEVKKYINQVAFSGAEDFISRYKDKMDEQNQIIGHFGLGFYSSFMVSEKVEIDTLSYQEGAQGVKWSCSGGTEYELEDSDTARRGTTVTLYIDNDNKEFLDEYRLREIIEKHCAFLPIEIYLENEEKAAEDKKDQKPLNDTHPLWIKNPKDCTDDEYKEFYRKVFHDYNEPLFWIHLYVDYPFNLKGILYFPKLKHELDASEGKIKLYNNQVFVADNIKEIIPEFLILLKGVIDCSDLPLNVSRSFLQKDKEIAKITKHISKKVADKLTELYSNEKERYCKLWDDINPFIKYGCLRDDKFYEKVKDVIVYKNINDEYVTLSQYIESQADKEEKKVFYVSDMKQQSQYVKLFRDNDLDAIILNSSIDSHFISYLEMSEKNIKFLRIDADLSESLKNTSDSNEQDVNKLEVLEKLFKAAVQDDKLAVRLEGLKTSEIPAIMLLSEHTRRMQEFSAMLGGKDFAPTFPSEHTLILNTNNTLIERVLQLSDKENKEQDLTLICQHIYDLAILSHKQMDTEAMTRFINRNHELLMRLAEI